jgi:hypothetical protein
MSKPTQQTNGHGKPELPTMPTEFGARFAEGLRRFALGHDIDQETEQLTDEVMTALHPLLDDDLEQVVKNVIALIRDARLIGLEDGQRAACNISGRMLVLTEHLKRAAQEAANLLRLTA